MVSIINNVPSVLLVGSIIGWKLHQKAGCELLSVAVNLPSFREKMAPKKKLSKKEKARLEAEQAELLRIEMEKEKMKKLEEARQRKKVEREQAKRRQQQEIHENKLRRAQLKSSMEYFAKIKESIDEIKNKDQEEKDWQKYMRCNGLPNTNSPSDLRQYIHQWQSDIKKRNKESRNWLLQTDERTLLTQDQKILDLTKATLRKKQGNLGDIYSRRIKEVLDILEELEDSIAQTNKPPHILDDLSKLKTDIRVLIKEHLDEFTFKIMSHIERDMDIDRPGVYKNIYSSDVFKSFIWSFAKDAQISLNPKARIGEQVQSNDIDFPTISVDISFPASVQLRSSSLRGLWLSYDHFSDYCGSFKLKRPRPGHITMLTQTKKEWRKRREILQNMLDECSKEVPLSEIENLDQESSPSSQQTKEKVFDVDKIYTEYEDELNKMRKHAIGPSAYGLVETDVNLRKYRIIGGVFCVDYMEIPEQDKQLNSRSFIRTTFSPDVLQQKVYYQTYKPPPAVQPGVRRLPEEIEAEMRMIEAALEKLASVSIQLPDSVIWFEPPIPCRWETEVETIESDLTEGSKPPTTASPTEATSLSVTTNASPLKSSPRFPARLRKRHLQKQREDNLPRREIEDFDLFNVPPNVDLYELFKDFVVPRLPIGFCIRMEKSEASIIEQKQKSRKLKNRVLYLARQKNIEIGQSTEQVSDITDMLIQSVVSKTHDVRLTAEHLNLNEPRPLFPKIQLKKILKFKKQISEDIVEAPPKAESRKDSLASKTRKSTTSVESESETVLSKGSKGSKGSKISKSEKGSNKTTPTSSQKQSKDSSRRSSDQKVQKPPSVEKNYYMFSELISDLEHLYHLQLPVEQQEETLQQIAENLINSASAPGSHEGNLDENEGEIKQKPDLTPAGGYPYFSGISFIKDGEMKNGNNEDKHSDDTDEEIVDNDESSSGFDDDDDYDDDDEYLYGLNQDNDITLGNLRTPSPFGKNMGGPEGGDGGAADSSTISMKQRMRQLKADGEGKAKADVHDFLSKHSQSESDTSDGKKMKQLNLAMLTQGKWSTRDVHDTKFNEDKLQMQFRSGRLGIFGFAMNRYSNMPYQTWDIRPDIKCPGSGNILFSFTASIVSLDITISSSGFIVQNFQGGTTTTINDILGKTLSLAELKATLISSAVDIFPDEDAFCYTEGSCEKNYVMEMHLYKCMSTLAQSYNFSWSRWNLLAGTRTAVLLLREVIEGKKLPYYSTLLVTPLKSSIIDCTEVSASFNSVGIQGMEYYADLYQLSQVHAQPSSLEKQRKMNPVLRDNVAQILIAVRPLSFC